MTPEDLVSAVEGAGFDNTTFPAAMSALALLMQRQTIQSQLVTLQQNRAEADSAALQAISAKQAELDALQAQIDAALGGGV